MRIGVNLIPLRPGQMGGHEFYIRRLLTPILAQDQGNRYFLFTAYWNDASVEFPSGRYQKILAVRPPHEDTTFAHGRQAERSRFFGLPSLSRTRRLAPTSPLDLHDWVRRLKLDLWFCPMVDLDPRHLPIPTVVTIADIQQEYYPEFFTSAELRQRAMMYMPSCQEATAVITVSHASEQSLIEKYGIAADKVHCVYEAGPDRLFEPSDAPSIESVRRKYQLPETYAFYPANLWPHKNHHMLILALHRLREVYGQSVSIVLTGDDMGRWKELAELAGHFGLAETIRHLGYVGSEELPSLYAGAALLVFPSLFEGFGIPLVEAMALGCPIAAANHASIPEVVGEAALLFDPRNPDSIAEAMHRLLSDVTLRQSLSARGYEQARLFSWEKAARETLRVFAWARAHGDTVQQMPERHRAWISGVYSDGWATRKVRLELPCLLQYLEEMEAVKLSGVTRYLDYPVTMRMKVNGRVAGEVLIEGPGSFTLVGALRRSWRASSRFTIDLLANRDFIPERVEAAKDSRSLAYTIERLALICRGGGEVQLYAPLSRSAES